MTQLSDITYKAYTRSGMTYTELKAQIREALIGVSQFSIKFSCPPTLSTLSHVKTGSTRVFKRKMGTNNFVLSSTKILVGVSCIARIVSTNQGEIVVPD